MWYLYCLVNNHQKCSVLLLYYVAQRSIKTTGRRLSCKTTNEFPFIVSHSSGGDGSGDASYGGSHTDSGSGNGSGSSNDAISGTDAGTFIDDKHWE